jgi:hypothetical protein
MRESGTAYVPTLSVVIAGVRGRAGRSLYLRPIVGEGLRAELAEALRGEEPNTKGSAVGFGTKGIGESNERLALENLKRVVEAGLEIGRGTDAGNAWVPPGAAALAELTLYVEAGLTPARALAAATLGSAKILGVADRLGTLETGKLADLVVFEGDPTVAIDDVWTIRHVVKAGRPVDREALRGGAAAPVEPPSTVLVAGDALPAEVDAFDDGDLDSAWGGTWTSWSDSVAPGGASTATVALAEADGAKVLRLEGAIREGFQWGAWAGATIAWGDAGSVVDAARYRGFRLRVRGTPRTYTFTVQRAAVTDYNVFSTLLPVVEDWSEVEIPFSSLRQIGFGRPVDWAANDFTGLTIDARNVTGSAEKLGDFRVEIDWIRVEESTGAGTR